MVTGEKVRARCQSRSGQIPQCLRVLPVELLHVLGALGKAPVRKQVCAVRYSLFSVVSGWGWEVGVGVGVDLLRLYFRYLTN